MSRKAAETDKILPKPIRDLRRMMTLGKEIRGRIGELGKAASVKLTRQERDSRKRAGK